HSIGGGLGRVSSHSARGFRRRLQRDSRKRPRRSRRRSGAGRTQRGIDQRFDKKVTNKVGNRGETRCADASLRQPSRLDRTFGSFDAYCCHMDAAWFITIGGGTIGIGGLILRDYFLWRRSQGLPMFWPQKISRPLWISFSVLGVFVGVGLVLPVLARTRETCCH